MADTYYVDFVGGNNSTALVNRQDLPFADWSPFLNSSIGAGDTISFKRGTSLFQQLKQGAMYLRGLNPSYPAEATPDDLTFNAWGDSQYPPMISPTSTISSGSWSGPVDGVYYQSATINQLFEDHLPLPLHTDANCPAGTWFQSGGTLYYHPTSGDLSALVERDWDESAIYSDGGASNILIDGLGFTAEGVKINSAYGPTSYITVQNCAFINGAMGKFLSNYGDSADYITIDSCTFNNAKYNSLMFQPYVNEAEVNRTFNHTVISNNVIADNDTLPTTGSMWHVADGDCDAVYSQNFVNLLMEKNEVSGYTGNGRFSAGFWCWIDPNTTQQCINNIIRRNYFHDLGNGIKWDQSSSPTNHSIEIYHNIIANIGKGGARGMCIEGTAGQDSTLKGRIYNNTLYNGVYGVELNTGDYYEIKNNIIHTMSGTYINITPGSGTHNVVDYNCYYDVSDNGDHWCSADSYTPKDWTDWTALGFDANSIRINPQLIAPGTGTHPDTDYKIQPGSACINAGVDVSLTVDYGGFSITGLPDMGAWEDSGIIYSRGNYSVLPADDANLETIYTSADIAGVAANDADMVSQSATGQYALHQFKVDATGKSSVTITWIGQVNKSPAVSTVYLQIYDRSGTPAWDTIDFDNSSGINIDFELKAYIDSLDNYKDANGIIACRVYQQA